MKSETSNEQRFIADVDAFKFITHDVTTIVNAMEDWLADLKTHLRSNRLTWNGLKAQNQLARKADAINMAVDRSVEGWTKQWRDYEPARAFADSFDDKALLLVFGKFNAGKSSFCNLLADRFAAHGKEVRYFYLEGGRIVETPERFAEGVTETTSRLQGVRLADKLVLVDTPGLHSVTQENASLTQRFADSADGVLWLTSSTSPGQVQELDELGRELHRNKPLLPVVTRSDVYEEDEVNGEICKVLRNKTPENRAQQEADVEVRAGEKLSQMGTAIGLLKPPVSISTYFASTAGQTKTAMAEAGFERLFAALVAIIEATLAYKRRKQAEVFLHHLEENVIGVVSSGVVSLLRELRSESASEEVTLEAQREQLGNALWRTVVPELPRLLDEYFVTLDLQAIATQLSDCIKAALLAHVNNFLCDYAIDQGVLDTTLEIQRDASFMQEQACEETTADYQHLHEALTKAIRSLVMRLVNEVIVQCRSALFQLDELIQGLEAALCAHEEELLVIKRDLRSEFD